MVTVDYLECLRQQEYLAGLYRLPQAQQFLGALAKEAEKLDDSFIKGSYPDTKMALLSPTVAK